MMVPEDSAAAADLADPADSVVLTLQAAEHRAVTWRWWSWRWWIRRRRRGTRRRRWTWRSRRRPRWTPRRTWPPRDRNGNNAFIGNRARGNTNRITGSLFYTFGNSVLNARPFSIDGLEAPKAAYSQNKFGVSAGGPLFIPKLFNFDKITWFFNYTGNLLRNGVDQPSSVPTAAQRTGDLSSVSADHFRSDDGLAVSGQCDSELPHQPDFALGLLNFIPLPNQATPTINQDYRLIYGESEQYPGPQYQAERDGDAEG